MASIQNGNLESSPELEEGVFKVVVIGEPRCGKTRFIRAFYDRHSPGAIYSHNGVRVYPCEFEGNKEMKKASIYEIPGDPDFFPEQRIPHYEQADAIIFMYAIDDPASLQALTANWIEEAINIITSNHIPVTFVGTKQDLRDDQQVIERLALENQSPVTFQQASEITDGIPGVVILTECSANDVNQVDSIFYNIFQILLVND